MVVFLACTKKKQGNPCKAKEIYRASQLFRGGWSYAESLHPDEIWILSAKYGLLHPDMIIAPYNKTLIKERDAEVRRWSMMVAKQIEHAGINRRQKAIFLCGKPYRKYIQNLFPDHETPCEHMGIGKQMQFFKEKAREMNA